MSAAPARKPVSPATTPGQRSFLAIQDDGVPPWMAQRGLKKGDYLMLSKAQLRTQQHPDKTLKVQVWATGMLHSPGYQGEEATTMRNGKKVPLTPGDISNELFGIAKQYYAKAGIEATPEQITALKETKEEIRRALMGLEDDGVAQRTDLAGTPLRDLSPDQLRRLPSGKTRIFFWLAPRTPDPKTVVREWNHRQRPDVSKVEVGFYLPPYPPILKILNIFHIEKPGKSQISDPIYHKRVESAFEKARMIFVSEMTGKVVSECLPKVVSTAPPEVGATGGAFERKVENELPSSSSNGVYRNQSSSSAFLPAKSKAEDEETSEWKVFAATYPAGHFDEGKAKPLFEKKPKADRMKMIERLGVYLHCDRWKSEDGRWIPLASNWLKDDNYKAAPPPAMRKQEHRPSKAADAYAAFAAGEDD